ncbi:hypothetical protein GCM10010435_17710 [Winogradskya consettensis]|uniref:Uncharacterized protein n=1 Tax=Winogradskya consettensis TaxID=113560 RepID=A0A919SVW3_9ACTN|nr:hypothetical protein [Actinoplanes consettensis]GIM78619.1 hypothetical protein Aco04nite_61340 [Actinoplanes consettensis]
MAKNRARALLPGPERPEPVVVLDEYLADYERRNGPVSEQTRQRARQVFDEALAEEV